MKGNFEKIIDWTLNWETYKVDDSRDPGKLTIWGISQKYHPMEVSQMLKLSKQEARNFAIEIYKQDYWDAHKCDSLTFPLDIVIFEIAVVPGAKTVKQALSIIRNWQEALLIRIKGFAESPNFNLYGKGWVNRTLSLFEYVKTLEGQL